MSDRTLPVIDLPATGRNILRLRRERGLSVRDLASYFGFEQVRAVYKWQKGECLPTVDNLLALSQLLRVSMEEILIFTPSGASIGSREESRDPAFLLSAGSGIGGFPEIRRDCTTGSLTVRAGLDTVKLAVFPDQSSGRWKLRPLLLYGWIAVHGKKQSEECG